MLLVHVTHFNDLMWDSGVTPTTVVEHGVAVPDDAQYRGRLARGIVVVNNLVRRGRRVGADIYHRARGQVPLDLVGMGSTAAGGLGEVAPPELPHFEARYRFFFNPIRYTSLGLAVCEAMAVGLPIVALATTEMVSVVDNGVTGWASTDPEVLINHMQRLVQDRDEAAELGSAAKKMAVARFGIERFARETVRGVRGRHRPRRVSGSRSSTAGRGSGSSSSATPCSTCGSRAPRASSHVRHRSPSCPSTGAPSARAARRTSPSTSPPSVRTWSSSR